MTKPPKDNETKLLTVPLPMGDYERLKKIANGGRVKVSMRQAAAFAIRYCLDRVGDDVAFDLSGNSPLDDSNKRAKRTSTNPGRTNKSHRAG